MSTNKKSDFIIPESQDKSKNKTKKTPATLDDVIKAVDKVSKNISDIPSDINSTITKNNKDQEQITNGKLKTITDKISEQNKNIQNLINEINKIKSSGTSSSKGTNNNNNASDINTLKAERLRQENIDKHSESEATVKKIEGEVEEIKAKTAKIQEDVTIARNKAILDNKAINNEISLKNKEFEADQLNRFKELELKFKENKAKTDKLDAETNKIKLDTLLRYQQGYADLSAKLDKHQAWQEDRDYILKQREKAKGFSISDLFRKKKTESENNRTNFNPNYQYNPYNAGFNDRFNFRDFSSFNNDSNNNSSTFSDIDLEDILNNARTWENNNMRGGSTPPQNQNIAGLLTFNHDSINNSGNDDNQNISTSRALVRTYNPNFTFGNEDTDSTINNQNFSGNSNFETSFSERYARTFEEIFSRANDAANNFYQAAEAQRNINQGSTSNTDKNEQLDLQKRLLEQVTIDSKISDEVLKRLTAESSEKYKVEENNRANFKQKFDAGLEIANLKLRIAKQERDAKFAEVNQESKRKLDNLKIAEKFAKYERDAEKHQAWQEDRAYDLEKRKKEDEATYKDSYKESKTYRAIDSVKNAHTGFGTSVMMSALTGGFINPAVINALKLDKLMMAPLEAFGKSLLRSKKKESGNYTTTSAIKNSKNADIIREMHVLGGKLDKIAEPKELGTKEKKSKGIFEKLGDLFGSLGGLVKGLGMAGIAMLIKYLFPKTMKALNDKFMGFLTDTVGLSEGTAQGINQLLKDALPGAIAGFTMGGFKGALIGAGLSISYNYIKRKWDEWHGNSENEGQIPSSIGPIPLRYAQAGIAGAAVGGLFGFKGMAIGLLTGIAGQGLWDLGKKLGEWAAAAVNWFSEHPMSAIGLSLLGLSNIGNIKRAISGVSTALKAAKGAIKDYSKHILDASINVGKATFNFTKNMAEIAFDKVKGGIIRLGGALGNAAVTVTRGIASNIISVLPNVKSGLLKMVKAAGWVGAALLAFDVGKMLGEKIAEYVQSKDHAKVKSKVDAVNSMSEEERAHYAQYLKDTGQWDAFTTGTVKGEHFWNFNKDYDYTKSLEEYRIAREKNPEKYGNNAPIVDIIEQFKNNSEKNSNKNKAEEQAKGIIEKTNNIKDGPENDAPANTNNINNINLNTEGSEKVNKYNDVPWNYNLFARNNIIPSEVASNLNSFHEDVISPLQRELGNNKIQITSSYRSPSYNASVGGARNSNHMRGNAIDLVVNGMSPTQVVNKLNEKEIPFDRALIEHLNGKQWLHLEYAANHSHPGIIAKMDAGGYKVVSNGNGEKQFLPEIVGGNEGEDLGISNIANVFSSGINDFYNLLSFMAGGEGYRSSAVNMTSSSSSASSMSSNASKEVQKLDTATIPSTEMTNTNELAQLNSSISGNGNNGSDSLANIMTNVAENTANANQNNSAPIVYNNNVTQTSNDDSVYPVGDLAKTLLYA